jgi:hypothetical protein
VNQDVVLRRSPPIDHYPPDEDSGRSQDADHAKVPEGMFTVGDSGQQREQQNQSRENAYVTLTRFRCQLHADNAGDHCGQEGARQIRGEIRAGEATRGGFRQKDQ